MFLLIGQGYYKHKRYVLTENKIANSEILQNDQSKTIQRYVRLEKQKQNERDESDY